MAQEYTVEQLNHGRKVYDFMRWDYWAFGISGLLLIAAIVIMGVRGFNWGLDFTGGTVIEITLEKPAEIDVMRDALQKAGFEEPMLQNFGSSHDIMVRMPPAEGETGGQVLGNVQVLDVQIQAVRPDLQRGGADDPAHRVPGRNRAGGFPAEIVIQPHIGVSGIVVHSISLPALAVAATLRQFRVSFA